MKKKSGFLGLFLICFLLVNSTYAKVGNTVIIGSNTIIGSSNPTNEWVKLTSTITAPTGTTRMRVLLSNDATCGSLGIFDDIYVTFSTVFDPRAGFPTPSVTGNSSVCQGTTTSLTGSTTTGAATWVSSNTDVATVSATGVVTGVSAGTATITYTVTEGNCTASATKAMTVNAQPSAPVTTFNNQFHGCKSVVPKAHTANSDPIFEWRDASGNILPSTMIDGGINSILSNPVTTSQTVYVFEQSANGCYSPATAVELIVYPLPAKNFTIEGTTFSCGTPITLTVNPPNTTANQAVEYWSNGSADGAFYGSGNSIVFSPTPPATSLSQSVFAFLRETHILPVNPITNQPDILKCYSENENISINIKPLPATPSVTNVTYCQNAIAAQLTAGTAGADLRWYTQATGSFPMCSQPPPPVDCPAPTPSTTEAGTTSYFVTQIVDGCESSPRAELTVIVNEPEPNPITCPENITVTAACDATTAVATWTAPTATASCGTEIPSLSSDYNSGDEFSVGTPTTVTYTATLGTDNRGYTATLGNETATCSFTVTVNAASVATPVLTACPENIIVTPPCGATKAVATWTAPTATASCGTEIPSLSSNYNSGAEFSVGTTEVIYTATLGTETATCSFTVTVNAASVATPVLSACPANITVTAACGAMKAPATWTAPTATASCGTETPTVSSDYSSGAEFSVGTTEVIYTATLGTETATCSFTVTVNAASVATPVLTACPANITVTAACGAMKAPATWTAPTATASCGTETPSLSSNYSSGAEFSVGTTTVTYTATLGTETKTCSFTVTVNAASIATPVLSACPANIRVTAACGAMKATATWTAPTATASCGTETPTVSSDYSSGDEFSVGTPTTVTYTATLGTETATCSFTVTVNAASIATPVLSACPANITVTAACGAMKAPATWTAPTATASCGTETPTVSSDYSSGAEFSVGTTEVIYTAALGTETKTCSFTVTVNAASVATPILTACPENIIVTPPCGATKAIVTWTAPTATASCGTATPSLSSNYSSGAEFSVGTTEVIYTAALGTETKTCSFTVTVNAASVATPILTACPENIIVTAACGATKAIVTWTAPTATASCGTATPSLSSNYSSGAEFSVGTTEVIYTATLGTETATCSFTVTVNAASVATPVLSACPSNIIVTAACGATKAIVTWTAPTATASCGTATPSLSSNYSSGAEFSVGTTEVIYTATLGTETKTCSFTVTVNAASVATPILTACPENIIVTPPCGATKAIVTWTAPTATASCGTETPTVSSDYSSGAEFSVGTTTVTYTATLGTETKTCSFTVTVNAASVATPILSACPENITVTAACGATKAIVTWTAPTATASCGTATPTVSSDYSSGAEFSVGTTTVTYTATLGTETKTCSFTVTVNAASVATPILSACPENITVTAACGATKAIVTWTAPTATASCGTATPSLSSNYSSGAEFSVGTTATVTYTATLGTRTATCSFTVTVNPTSTLLAPSVPPSNIIQPTCSMPTGTITVVPQTGVTYSFDNGDTYQNGNIKSGLIADIYKIKVKNVAGCVSTATLVTLTAATTVSVSILTNIAASYCTLNDLIVQAAPAGGVFKLDGQTQTTYNGYTILDCAFLSIGTHTLTYTVTQNGCKTVATKQFEITTNPPRPSVKTTSPACSTSGTITITNLPVGASSRLNNGPWRVNKTVYSGLSEGNYTVSFSQNGCESSRRVKLKVNDFDFDVTKCYKIVNRNSGKVLDVSGSGMGNNDPVIQYTLNGTHGTANQKWKIFKTRNGFIKLVAQHSQKVLACHQTTEGANVYQHDYYNTGEKDWKIECVGDYFRFKHRESGKYLSIEGNNANAEIRAWANLASQQWSIVEVACSNTLNLAQKAVFTATVAAEPIRIRLNWYSNLGKEVDFYQIEKLQEATNQFDKIELLNNLYSDEDVHSFAHFDNEPQEGDNIYRISAFLKDGTQRLSENLTVKFGRTDNLQVYPNPANTEIWLNLKVFEGRKAVVKINDAMGNPLLTTKIAAIQKTPLRLEIGDWSSGVYFIYVEIEGRKAQFQKIVIQK